MPRKWVTGCAFAGGLCASIAVSTTRAGVLYSTIAGAAAPGSTQPSYSASLKLAGDYTNAGPYGFGDDYTTSSPGLTGAQINAGANGNAFLIPTDSYVQLTSISYYGDLEPGPNGSVTTLRDGTKLYSLGGDLDFRFYDSSGTFDQAAGPISGPTATSTTANQPLTPSPVQGPGLHTITLSTPVYVPASGYFVIESYLASSNGGPGSTPVGTVGASFTGYFGAAPTVGSGTSGTFATTSANASGNRVLTTNSTFSNLPNPTPQNPDGAGDDYTYTVSPTGANSTGYLQVELDGNSLAVPEPGTLSVLAIGMLGVAKRRVRDERA